MGDASDKMTNTSETIHARYCEVCGRPTLNYGVVSESGVLCMEQPEEHYTEWGRNSAAEMSPCFGWFAGYPYNLKNLAGLRVQAVEAEFADKMDKIREFLTTLVSTMLKVEEVLAFHGEFPLIYELQGMGLIPEAKEWTPETG